MQPQGQQQATAVSIPAQAQYVPYFVTVSQPTVYPSFSKKHAVGLGITLIVAGALSIVFNAVLMGVSLFSSFGIIAPGIWVGILCIVSGGLGIGAGIHKTKSQICAFNVMCIISASLTTIQLSLGIAGSVISSCSSRNYYYYYYYCNVGGTVMGAFMAAAAVAEAVAAIWASVICCKTYCCCSTYSPLTSETGMTMINYNQQPQLMHHAAGYTGQPIQNAPVATFYPPQGQFVPAGQPPPYMIIQQSQPVLNVQAQPIEVAQPGTSAAAPQAPAIQAKTHQYDAK